MECAIELSTMTNTQKTKEMTMTEHSRMIKQALKDKWGAGLKHLSTDQVKAEAALELVRMMASMVNPKDATLTSLAADYHYLQTTAKEVLKGLN
jgi:hypothetical protein